MMQKFPKYLAKPLNILLSLAVMSSLYLGCGKRKDEDHTKVFLPATTRAVELSKKGDEQAQSNLTEEDCRKVLYDFYGCYNNALIKAQEMRDTSGFFLKYGFAIEPGDGKKISEEDLRAGQEKLKEIVGGYKIKPYDDSFVYYCDDTMVANLTKVNGYLKIASVREEDGKITYLSDYLADSILSESPSIQEKVLRPVNDKELEALLDPDVKKEMVIETNKGTLIFDSDDWHDYTDEAVLRQIFTKVLSGYYDKSIINRRGDFLCFGKDPAETLDLSYMGTKSQHVMAALLLVQAEEGQNKILLNKLGISTKKYTVATNYSPMAYVKRAFSPIGNIEGYYFDEDVYSYEKRVVMEATMADILNSINTGDSVRSVQMKITQKRDYTPAQILDSIRYHVSERNVTEALKWYRRSDKNDFIKEKIESLLDKWIIGSFGTFVVPKKTVSVEEFMGEEYRINLPPGVSIPYENLNRISYIEFDQVRTFERGTTLNDILNACEPKISIFDLRVHRRGYF